MRKCLWSATVVAVFALSGLYLAAQHAARHPDSNLGCFVRGLMACAPGCSVETKPVVRSPYASREQCAPAPCIHNPIEPIVVERSMDGLLDSRFDSGPPGSVESTVQPEGHLTPARVDSISPSGGEESDEPPPFMPLCPEDEPDGVRRMPYADDEEDDIELDLGIEEDSEECEDSLPRSRTDPHHHDPHYPSCPYTGGRCPAPGYRIVTPMPPATNSPAPGKPAPRN